MLFEVLVGQAVDRGFLVDLQNFCVVLAEAEGQFVEAIEVLAGICLHVDILHLGRLSKDL